MILKLNQYLATGVATKKEGNSKLPVHKQYQHHLAYQKGADFEFESFLNDESPHHTIDGYLKSSTSAALSPHCCRISDVAGGSEDPSISLSKVC